MNYHKAKLNYLLMFNELKNIDEQIIATNAWHSYLYATEILKGRFVLGETAIATVGWFPYHYAKDVLKGRFILGEPTIDTDPRCRNRYNIFLKYKGIDFQL